MEILYAAFAGSVIREGFGKIASMPISILISSLLPFRAPLPRATPNVQ
jgi:hypothetical protein